jgi:tetratricopeptide (TPR) repeat protein
MLPTATLLTATLLIATLLTIAAPATDACAAPSEEAEVQTLLGLINLGGGRPEAALKAFDKALAADPADLEARFQHGVANSQLGRWQEAANDFGAVLDGDPSRKSSVLGRGVALFQLGRLEEAATDLKQALDVPELAQQGSFYLGLCLRGSDPEQATKHFRSAVSEPQLGTTARYYLGMLAFEDFKFDEAREQFTAVAADKPNSEIGVQSQRYLKAIKQSEQNRYRVYASVGAQYDSNVALLNDLLESQAAGELDDLQGLNDRADERLTLQAGASGVIWEDAHSYAVVGYDFFQSLHADLDEFNLQDHRVWSEFVREAGLWTFDLGVAWDYYFLDQSSFLDQLAVITSASFDETDFGTTKIFYQARQQSFHLSPFNGTTQQPSGNTVGMRDALIHNAGLWQYFDLGGEGDRVYVGYTWEMLDADENDSQAQSFAYTGNHGHVGLEWTFPGGIDLDVQIEYREDRYDKDSALYSRDSQDNLTGERREDHELRGLIALRKRLSDRLSTTISYVGSDNDSDDARFDYDRNIASLSFEAEIW